MDHHFDAEAFTLLGVGVGVIAFRFVSRLVSLGIRNLRPDDYLMLLAAVCLNSPWVSTICANEVTFRFCMLAIPSPHIMWGYLAMVSQTRV